MTPLFDRCVGMWRVFWAFWCVVAEATERGVDIVGDGEFYRAGGVVPFEVDATKAAVRPVGGGFVLELEMLF